MCIAPYFNTVYEVWINKWKIKISQCFLFKNLLILFFMYLILSDQFNLLSIITPKNLVLLTFTNFFLQMCTLSSTVLFLIRADGTSYSEFLKILIVNLLDFSHWSTFSNSRFMSFMILLYAVPSMNTLVSSANSIENNKSDDLEKSLIYKTKRCMDPREYGSLGQ